MGDFRMENLGVYLFMKVVAISFSFPLRQTTPKTEFYSFSCD